MNKNNKIEILDSTLREGEQTPNVSFSKSEKIKIAIMLDKFGVDFIELGHPAVSKNIYDSIASLNGLKLNAKKIVHGRALKSDIDDAINLGVEWIGIFFGTSQELLKDKYNVNESGALKIIERGIKYAKDKGLKVRFTAEDASRTKKPFLFKIAELVQKSGIDRFSLADTVGILRPDKTSELVKSMVSFLDIPVHIHCHNDFGLATANAIEAVCSGAQCIDVTINGLGERCGLPPLAEVTTGLQELYGIKNNWNLKLLKNLSDYLDQITSLKTHEIRPITGQNAFTHKAGLHISAVVKNSKSYESISPKKLNRYHSMIIDQFVSKEAIIFRLNKLGINYTQKLIEHLINHIKTRPEITNWNDQKIISVIKEKEKFLKIHE